jgi:hypothetical protein
MTDRPLGRDGQFPIASRRPAAPGPRGGPPLLEVMRDPAGIARLDAEQLDGALHAARHHGLLARLEVDLAALGVLRQLPEAARRQLDHARIEAYANAVVLRFEVDRVRRALADLGTKIVLLKGAAYQQATLPPSRGRIAVDLDILVPAADMDRVERTLIEQGWHSDATDQYDQHYYRDWMHEIPPLIHAGRGTELDVHHSIFPPVSGIRIDTASLLAEAINLPDGLWVLSPADMVLHAATHLFQENPAGHLRDLLDLHDLLTGFGERAGFWDGLVERAHHHGLGRPLYYGLRYAGGLMGTAIPASVLDRAKAAFAPNGLHARVMDWLVRTSIVNRVPGQSGGAAAAARATLFVRSHWIKMPPMVLFGHFVAKLVRRARERREP